VKTEHYTNPSLAQGQGYPSFKPLFPLRGLYEGSIGWTEHFRCRILHPFLTHHMMKVAHDWNSGNFSLSHSAEVTEEQYAILANKGLLWFMQRNREHDKILGAFEMVGGKEKRKAGWKRQDIAYDAKLAEKLEGIYSSAEVESGNEISIDTVISENLREGKEIAYAEEKKVAAQRESLPEKEWEKWVEGIRAYGAFEDTHDGEDWSLDFLRAMNAKKKALMAGM
jgi:hypothetical protein